MNNSWFQIIESGNQVWVGNDYTAYNITANVDTNVQFNRIHCRIGGAYSTHQWTHLGLELKSVYELRFLLAFEARGYHT